MYAALWRLLPGPLWLRITIAALAVAAVVLLLAYVVYPWVASILPNIESTVQ